MDQPVELLAPDVVERRPPAGRREGPVPYGILGPLAVTGPAGEITITAGRDRVVLAMLLLHAGRTVTPADLVDAVWGDDAPVTARGQVQTCVSRLRRLLPSATSTLITDPAGYRMSVSDQDLDAAVFARLVGEARALAGTAPEAAGKRLREALDLWRGPALSGVESAVVRRRAAVLDEEYAVAMEDWIDLELAAGRGRDLVAELTGLVERYPLRERLRAQLMLALYRTGRQSDALAEYRRARDLLDEELGIEPGAPMQDLHRRILTGDVAPAPSARTGTSTVRTLPRTVGDFTGREGTVGKLLLAAADATVLAIDGMAGSGKTTLALRVAGLLADAYPDAQLFLDMQGHSEQQPLDPGVALLTLLRQLGVEPERIPADLEGRTGLWRTELARRRALVILDNAASSSQVAALLPASTGNLCLVTSRRRLTGLDGVHSESLPVLNEAEALALLEKIAGAKVVAEPEAAREVVRRCGRLPLAIRLAGARLAHRPRWGVADLVRRLGESALPELAAEDRTVASAFALSYGQLSVRAQSVFRLLGLHPAGRFGAPAVAALTGLALEDARDLLDDLVDVHLLEEPEPERYRLHDLVRQYAATLAEALPVSERHAALAGLVDLHLYVGTRLAHQWEGGLAHEDFPTESPARPELVAHAAADSGWQEENRGSLMPLIRLAAAIEQPRRAWQLARVNWRFLYLHGYFADVISTCAVGLEIAEASGDRRGVAVMHNYLASGYLQSGRVEEALTSVNAMLDHQVRTGSVAGEGRALGNRSGVLHYLGRLAEASVDIKRAHRLMSGIGHLSAPVGMRIDIALNLLALGRYAEALRHSRIALQRIVETRGHKLSGALLAVGQARLNLGHLPQAERLARTALAAARRLGIRTDESESFNLLGAVALAQDRPAVAVEHHLAALQVGREHGRLPRVAQYSNDLARALRVVGDVTGAIELHRQALDIARRSKYLHEEGKALSGLATCLAADDPATARRYWTQALDIFTRMGVPEKDEVARQLAAVDGRDD
ncbi:BTAD domain-containing putative transcriptional regulator [Actinoplanes sp. NPDC049548]|uniref:AfsR/SARP family transcriptional regulator n=1 Tax=Actinoplanes sp. NPDC049548 TaxID=3155152 RepID=UPI00342FA80D